LRLLRRAQCRRAYRQLPLVLPGGGRRRDGSAIIELGRDLVEPGRRATLPSQVSREGWSARR